MGNLSSYTNSFVYRGLWSSVTVYKANDIVEGSNGSAYKCNVNGTTGVSKNPISDAVNWSSFIPSQLSISGSVSNVVSATTFGINAGSTWSWATSEWTLTNTGSSVTLTKSKSNCNCNCNCNCTGVNCNCASNCNCSNYPWSPCYCNCSNCSTSVYGYSGLCTCVSNCNCYSDCNCYSNCNCNCTPI
jgi:hypothetical protein